VACIISATNLGLYAFSYFFSAAVTLEILQISKDSSEKKVNEKLSIAMEYNLCNTTYYKSVLPLMVLEASWMI